MSSCTDTVPSLKSAFIRRSVVTQRGAAYYDVCSKKIIQGDRQILKQIEYCRKENNLSSCVS